MQTAINFRPIRVIRRGVHCRKVLVWLGKSYLTVDVSDEHSAANVVKLARKARGK